MCRSFVYSWLTSMYFIIPVAVVNGIFSVIFPSSYCGWGEMLLICARWFVPGKLPETCQFSFVSAFLLSKLTFYVSTATVKKQPPYLISVVGGWWGLWVWLRKEWKMLPPPGRGQASVMWTSRVSVASETCSQATDHCDRRKSGLTFSGNRKGEERGCYQKERGRDLERRRKKTEK